MESGWDRAIFEGLTGARAYRALRFCAWWVALLGVAFALHFALEDGGGAWARGVLPGVMGLLGLVGSLAGLALFFGMLAFLVRCDRSGWVARGIGGLFFAIGGCFTASACFFFVFRRARLRLEEWR